MLVLATGAAHYNARTLWPVLGGPQQTEPARPGRRAVYAGGLGGEEIASAEDGSGEQSRLERRQRPAPRTALMLLRVVHEHEETNSHGRSNTSLR